MQLKEFSLISPAIESGTVLKALETAIPTKAITQAIVDTHSNEERKRALPTHLVICLVDLSENFKARLFKALGQNFDIFGKTEP